MIFKIKGFSLLIFLILIQSCSGGRIGNFLESSFDGVENKNKISFTKKTIPDKKGLTFDKVESNPIKIKELKKEENKKNSKSNLDLVKIEKVVNDKKKIQVIKNQEKSLIKQDNIEFSTLEKKKNRTKKINKVIKSENKRKIELQTYKIMLLLKDVDPKYPIDELSKILRNSKLNFEIEKIERYQDSINKNIKRN